MRDTTRALADWLLGGGNRIGQIEIRAHAGEWVLRNANDVAGAGVRYDSWREARALANFDDAGRYRPLKTAPNLRHGWELWLRDVGEVRRALDYFYPGMLGVWLAHAAGELVPVHLRETLGRQTGMYRITAKLTDEQAQRLICKMCSPAACMKKILWQVDAEQPIATLPAEKFAQPEGGGLALLCHEACNLLVAEARKVVKGGE